MKKIILITTFLLFIKLHLGFAVNNPIKTSFLLTTKSNLFASIYMGDIISGGVNYEVYAYWPDTNVDKIKWIVYVPPYTYQYTSPSFSGFIYNGGSNVNATFVDINGNTINYDGPLY